MKRKIYEDLLVKISKLILKSSYFRGIPPEMFIAMDDFKGPKQLAQYLNMLQTNM